MSDYLSKFKHALNSGEKENAVRLCLDAVSTGQLSLLQLYTEVLAPALNSIECSSSDWECIWREHISTSIVRTILENCYPVVLKQRDEQGTKKEHGTVLIFCPPDEYHDLGARMVTDFFTLAGFKAIFVGNNTPKKSFLSAIGRIEPRYVAISISNPYHLFQTRKVIEEIRNSCPPSLKIVVGGQAFLNNKKAYKEIGADILLESFEDIEELVGGGK